MRLSSNPPLNWSLHLGLVAIATFLCLGQSPATRADDATVARTAEDRGTIAPAAGGRLQFIQRGTELILPTADDRTTWTLELPAKWIVESAARVGDATWISGRSNAASIDDMFVARIDETGPIELMPTPPGREQPRGRTGLLVERGRVVGITWLEGASQETTSVRAAAWNGEAWDAPEVVAPPLGREQTHLDSIVLADGSWLAVWAVVDGDSVPDDDIAWSRRDLGSWSQPQLVHTDNDAPDIRPSLALTGVGVLVAWTAYDGSDYRIHVAVLREDSWVERPLLGGKGAIPRRFVITAGRAALLYTSIVPNSWNLTELTVDGRALRNSANPNTADETPLLIIDSKGTKGLWPPTRGAGTAVEFVPAPLSDGTP